MILTSRCLASKFQVLHKKRVKICWNKGSILHTIICIYILYEFCIQIVYMIFMTYPFCRSELMFAKFIQNVCIQNVSHYTFCIQSFATIALLILYTKCIQTFVQMWYTFSIRRGYSIWKKFVRLTKLQCFLLFQILKCLTSHMYHYRS